uniref:Uncharacterized protein n=1 Tax=viral metagenome TaxID=1070528 RepID=A0A6M3K1M2_9ZZZZ
MTANKNLKKYVKSLSQTQDEIAKEIGIARIYFNAILNGKVRPGREASQKIEKWSGGLFKAADLMQL